MCVCVCVCVCVKPSEKLLDLNNYSADRADILCALKADVALSVISFSLKLSHGLEIYDDLNFLKNVCNRYSRTNFTQSS